MLLRNQPTPAQADGVWKRICSQIPDSDCNPDVSPQSGGESDPHSMKSGEIFLLDSLDVKHQLHSVKRLRGSVTMTPETIRIISQLRQEFYSLFAAAMEVPVKITNRNSFAGNLSIASWVNSQQQLNYMCIFAHTAPDELVPQRPLTLRLAVNKGGDVIAVVRQQKNVQELNQSWYFELTLLPEEILDFLPWIVSLIKTYDTDSVSSVPEPPYPLDSKLSTTRFFQKTRTQGASRKLSQGLFSQQECPPYLSSFQKRRFG